MLIILCSCKNTNDVFKIAQSRSEKRIILRMASEDSTILSVKMPNKFELKNNSYTNRAFVKIDYKYNHKESKWRNLGFELYDVEKYQPVTTRGKKTILGNKKLQYVYYTRHYLDSTKSTQKHLKVYVEQMLKENKDTLHIGTVADFKVKHKELFEKLTKKDSISIRFLDGEKMGERIMVPVEW